MRHIRILYAGMKYDYGDPRRGYSYEHSNFYATLRKMTECSLDYFTFDEVMRTSGRRGMNALLLSRVRETRPDLCFFFLFTDEITPDTLSDITQQSGAITLNWFADDHWRFDGFSRFYAPCFHWVVTTDSLALEKYRALGCRNVIKSQWGFNPTAETPHDLLPSYDVTFVGQAHSIRKEMIGALRRAGIPVCCWGKGWNAGRLPQNDMNSIFLRSKINLNFTESSNTLALKPAVKVLLHRRADGSLVFNAPGPVVANVRSLFADRRAQIKGRNFEIPGAGGFLLTSPADNLQEYFVPGEEVGLFRDVEELIEKARYYLLHDEERERIRAQGRDRALREHTYRCRFRDIFDRIGL